MSTHQLLSHPRRFKVVVLDYDLHAANSIIDARPTLEKAFPDLGERLRIWDIRQ